MQIADLAWHEVDTTTIQNCWRKAEILPEILTPAPQPTIPISSLLNVSSVHPDPIIQAERQVEEALNDLVATGALQKDNWMDIESLLNPEGKSHVMTESTDLEIYQDVMDAKAARENLEINGGDNLDGGTPIESQPSHRNVLNAMYTISKYLSDINDPNTRKIEALLSELNRNIWCEQTRDLRSTTILDFFTS